jgi:hypothetical protein
MPAKSTRTQSFAPMPSSRLFSAEGHVCSHTTYVCELASQTLRHALDSIAHELHNTARTDTKAGCELIASRGPDAGHAMDPLATRGSRSNS